ncbi:Eukaryotic elongation factor 2 kinase, partial [Diplonema papillatum]
MGACVQQGGDRSKGKGAKCVATSYPLGFRDVSSFKKAMDTLQEFIVELRDELLEVGPMGDLRERVDAARALLVKEGVLKAAPAENAGGVKVSPGIRRGTISGTDPLAAYNPPVLGDRRTTRRSTSLRAGMVPFHIHRNAPFLRDVTLEAQHWVHFHRLCKYGHWHGTAHKAHDCEKCVKDCGGGAWSRAKLRDENNNLVRAERKRISSLLTQAMHIVLHRSRGNNPYKTFAASKAGVRDAMKIVYNVPTSSWRQRVTPVVLEEESFAQGAMRKCWRMIESPDEKPAPCVAKKYINGSDELAHWVDTKMQSVAKHYANLFSQHRACMHSVDFIEAYLIAIDGESPGEKPEVYSIEHFLEGKYVKYNNNSGYCLSHRNTPQAFSHFTWAQSNGELMVVDIQGVGDLYTDPQIHTWDGKGYGDGNLGLTGMSLFFNSHVCNYICKAMQLKPFEIYHGRPARRVDDHTRTPASVREQAAKAAGEAKKDIEAVAYDELHPTAILPTSLLLNGGALEESAAASTAYASPLSPRMTPATPMVDARPPKLPDLDDPNCFPEDQTVEPLDGLTDAPLDEKEANRGAIHMKLAELHAVGRFNDNVPDV